MLSPYIITDAHNWLMSGDEVREKYENQEILEKR